MANCGNYLFIGLSDWCNANSTDEELPWNRLLGGRSHWITNTHKARWNGKKDKCNTVSGRLFRAAGSCIGDSDGCSANCQQHPIYRYGAITLASIRLLTITAGQIGFFRMGRVVAFSIARASASPCAAVSMNSVRFEFMEICCIFLST